MNKYPGAMRQNPIDKNDRDSETTAVYIPWNESGITKPEAIKALEYFESTAWLFRYKGLLVMTDESLYLTDAGDGTAAAPFGGPRFTAENIEDIELWLADVWHELLEDIEETSDEREEVEE